MLCVPVPAAAALQLAVPLPLSVMPAPLNVPEGAWLPVSVTAEASKQYGPLNPLKLTVGNGSTVTVAEPLATWPQYISVILSNI